MSGIHEEHEKASIANRRLIIIFSIQIFLFLILIIRLFFLQIVNYEKYKNDVIKFGVAGLSGLFSLGIQMGMLALQGSLLRLPCQ